MVKMGRRFTSKKFRDSDEFAENLAIENMLKCWNAITVEITLCRALRRQLPLAGLLSTCSARVRHRNPKPAASSDRHHRKRRAATHSAHWVVQRRLRNHSSRQEVSSLALEAEVHKQAAGSLAPIQARHKGNNKVELLEALFFRRQGGRRRRLAVDY